MPSLAASATPDFNDALIAFTSVNPLSASSTLAGLKEIPFSARALDDITAISARVIWPFGSNSPASFPFTMPFLTAEAT
ncbi:hypothetical protein D3C86_2132050 [compost metagenome]